jgi:hypothetical protein
VRKVLLGVSGLLAVAALGCGGDDDGASSTTTVSTAPPTTLISFSDWEAATDAVCAQHLPVLEDFVTTMGEPTTIAEVQVLLDGLLAINSAFTAALVATPVPDDRRVDVRQTYHLFTTTDALLDESAASLVQGDFAGADLKLAEYDARFGEADELLRSFDLPNCNGTG